MRPDPFALSVALAISCSGGAPAPERDGASSSPAVEHGDHRPHHGGLVLMHGDLHFEVVFDPQGRHLVYLTDEVRRELPAAAASGVRITILRSESDAPETLELEVDEFGESWVAEGRAVEEPESRAIVTVVHQGQPYEIELPFFDASVPDPHASH